MKRVKVAVASISMRIVSLEKRRADVQAYIARAARGGAALVCFPEYLPMQMTREAVDLPATPYYTLAEEFPAGEFTAMIRDACKRRRISALYGTVGRCDDGKVYNIVASISSQGRLIDSYRKTHLASGETPFEKISAGDVLKPLKTEFGAVGAITCCEINFPEIAQTYQSKGVQFFFCPTAATTEMSYTLAMVRARENFTPLVYASYAWAKGAKKGTCASAIFDALGTPIARSIHSSRLIFGEVDLEAPVGSPYWDRPKVRKNLRNWNIKRRRKELYKL
ncbi:MAG: carbon-nitrogen hydrolase family protein [Planctomycetes bacterium]|nr:carbon-nitrogen hydrolase family protein [Planctomycetota bacterium]